MNIKNINIKNIKNLKNIILVLIILTLLSYRLNGFYGDGGGRSFIDFLMDKDQFRAQTDKIGVSFGLENDRVQNLEMLKITVGFNGKTSGIILDNWTNDYSESQKLTTYIRPAVTVGLGYKTRFFNFALGYQFKFIDKTYLVHTPMFAFTCLNDTIRFNFPLAIGIGNGSATNTWVLSTAIEVRYYPKTVLDQIRLYIFYGYARMSYASYVKTEENMQVDPNDDKVYKAQSSVGFDLRFYFKFLKDSVKTNWRGEHLQFSIEPYLRTVYSMALKTLENQGGVHIKYGGNNYDITAYGFDPKSLGFVHDANDASERFSGGYVASLPAIPNPQGANSIYDIFRVGVALPLGLRASCENYGLYLEPSLSLTLIDGKNISISGISKYGPFYTLGWVVYSEIYFTPIPELELYLELQTGGATRWGNLDPADLGGTTLVINTSAGIIWYF